MVLNAAVHRKKPQAGHREAAYRNFYCYVNEVTLLTVLQRCSFSPNHYVWSV